MRTGGIDLAAQPQSTAFCVIAWTDGRAHVVRLDETVADAQLATAVREVAKLGVDAPLGWPREFVHAVTTHSNLAAWPPTPDRRLRFRRTDHVVHARTGRWPLSVSTDRIGVTAFRAARVLPPMRRDGSETLVEVYPAASLRCWGFNPEGYKKNASVRGQLVAALLVAAPWLNLGAFARAVKQNDNALDALIAALTARAAAVGLTSPPSSSDAAEAALEGWIALPIEDSLSKLASSKPG